MSAVPTPSDPPERDPNLSIGEQERSSRLQTFEEYLATPEGEITNDEIISAQKRYFINGRGSTGYNMKEVRAYVYGKRAEGEEVDLSEITHSIAKNNVRERKFVQYLEKIFDDCANAGDINAVLDMVLDPQLIDDTFLWKFAPYDVSTSAVGMNYDTKILKLLNNTIDKINLSPNEAEDIGSTFGVKLIELDQYVAGRDDVTRRLLGIRLKGSISLLSKESGYFTDEEEDDDHDNAAEEITNSAKSISSRVALVFLRDSLGYSSMPKRRGPKKRNPVIAENLNAEQRVHRPEQASRTEEKLFAVYSQVENVIDLRASEGRKNAIILAKILRKIKESNLDMSPREMLLELGMHVTDHVNKSRSLNLKEIDTKSELYSEVSRSIDRIIDVLSVIDKNETEGTLIDDFRDTVLAVHGLDQEKSNTTGVLEREDVLLRYPEYRRAREQFPRLETLDIRQYSAQQIHEVYLQDISSIE